MYLPHSRQDPAKINGGLQNVARGGHEGSDELLDPTALDENLERVSALCAQAKIRSFVPLLVRRHVSDDLHERVHQAQPAVTACRVFERRSANVDIHPSHVMPSNGRGRDRGPR